MGDAPHRHAVRGRPHHQDLRLPVHQLVHLALLHRVRASERPAALWFQGSVGGAALRPLPARWVHGHPLHPARAADRHQDPDALPAGAVAWIVRQGPVPQEKEGVLGGRQAVAAADGAARVQADEVSRCPLRACRTAPCPCPPARRVCLPAHSELHITHSPLCPTALPARARARDIDPTLGGTVPRDVQAHSRCAPARAYPAAAAVSDSAGPRACRRTLLTPSCSRWLHGTLRCTALSCHALRMARSHAGVLRDGHPVRVRDHVCVRIPPWSHHLLAEQPGRAQDGCGETRPPVPPAAIPRRRGHRHMGRHLCTHLQDRGDHKRADPNLHIQLHVGDAYQGVRLTAGRPHLAHHRRALRVCGTGACRLPRARHAVLG
mmetsp:Transcript_10830/g.28102  ORF Transcript_10830/g.28102 Transcript_10830/m.28102 type:complete len:377 (+) Transcript_10830:1422-2552(+)